MYEWVSVNWMAMAMAFSNLVSYCFADVTLTIVFFLLLFPHLFYIQLFFSSYFFKHKVFYVQLCLMILSFVFFFIKAINKSFTNLVNCDRISKVSSFFWEISCFLYFPSAENGLFRWFICSLHIMKWRNES